MDESRGDGRRRHRKLIRLGIVAAFAAVIVPANWRIASKAGYRPALSLLTIISPLNVLMLWRFATREWPIERKLRSLQGIARADETTG